MARQDEDREDTGDRPRRRPRLDEDRDDDDRSRRNRPKRDAIEATDFLIPTNVSAASMAACYFGIFSCFLPLVGFLMAIIALPCGIVALQRRKKSNSYGAVTGDVRAIIGVISSSLTILAHLVFGTIYILANTGVLK